MPIGDTWRCLPSAERASTQGVVADRWKRSAETTINSSAVPSRSRLRGRFPGEGFNSGRLHVDADVGDRDRDRAVQRSTSLEAFDQCRGGRTVRAVHGEVHPHRVEERDVGACLTGAIDLAMNGDAHGPDLDARVAGDDLNQLDAAGGHGGEEQFGWRDFLAGTAVLHGAIHDEVMIAGLAQHASENVGGAGGDVVLA